MPEGKAKIGVLEEQTQGEFVQSTLRAPPTRVPGLLWNGAHQGSASAQLWALVSHNAPGSEVRAPGGDRAAAATAELGGFAGRGPGVRGGGASGGRGGAGPEAAVSAVGSSCVAVAGSRRGLGRTILSLGDLSTRSCDKIPTVSQDEKTTPWSVEAQVSSGAPPPRA
ncbi:uncharacterized PE-PGRS family protein PE_PGRS20-like [Mustela erminea]|uniref:uncharacterized PE-PGRS family protein PE_PGRS20-like n=1 Tax=Mustela erminea TaxID=36723 RepID=UPI00138750DF|nr:uncharacterized PE-PGRS family protein PE_PGRS20-like [Mustela erminea]